LLLTITVLVGDLNSSAANGCLRGLLALAKKAVIA